mmetsp:Transcript_99514/g.280801  ORF Transcript_99514/g.280801 Transcript_99514/m.280801 type:complete len:233 (-) Transcript_99514:467-1165(-)
MRNTRSWSLLKIARPCSVCTKFYATLRGLQPPSRLCAYATMVAEGHSAPGVAACNPTGIPASCSRVRKRFSRTTRFREVCRTCVRVAECTWTSSPSSLAASLASCFNTDVMGASPLTSMPSRFVRSKIALSFWGNCTNSSNVALDRCCASRSEQRPNNWLSSASGTRCLASSSAVVTRTAVTASLSKLSSSCRPNNSSHCPRKSRSKPRSIFSTEMMFCATFFRAGAMLSTS